ncbi:antitoxin VapB family protein [Haloterrigena alkaliphila]|uniref:Antitoxin VapB family protein n=1 Tax=Haloterrigena alkaliphila TaxID=2816475 RepID=A0A8A2VCZ1_9EURY|nr:antitoxin VapB family protein [Haloterrigena alkaliphila]QSW98580.1 antitoxin VapB family protein [Haloterrigena alkaliphila]
MATKSLTITEEAYDRLREHKREGESFTETILRLTDRDRDVMKGFGAMRDADGIRDAVDSTRGELDADLRERERRR